MDDKQEFTFDQKIDILWSTCALGLENGSKLVKELFFDLNDMNFQRTDNDLTYS